MIDDKTDQNVYYENSVFEVFGIPVAWIPWFYTPDPSVKQRSGFLAPSYGVDSSLGYMIGIPYYWAISPNYDLTLMPEFTTKAGYLMQADWRQRLWNGAYEVKLAGAFNDQAQDFLGDRNWRGSVETKGNFALNSHWTVGWNAILESDDTFRRFYKLDDIYATERVSSVFLTGMGDRNYFNMTFAQYGNLTGNAYDYETNTYQKTVTATAYPVIDYNYIHNKPVFGGELSFDLNALALSVNDPANLLPPAYRGTMDHIVTQAQWRRTLTDDMGERFTPFVLGRADLYNVSNFQDIDGVTGRGHLHPADDRSGPGLPLSFCCPHRKRIARHRARGSDYRPRRRLQLACSQRGLCKASCSTTRCCSTSTSFQATTASRTIHERISGCSTPTRTITASA